MSESWCRFCKHNKLKFTEREGLFLVCDLGLEDVPHCKGYVEKQPVEATE
jgi:hypothetical protein